MKNLDKTGIYISDGKVTLKRFYKRGFFEMENYILHPTKVPPGAKFEKTKNEIFQKENILDLDSDGLHKIYQFFDEESLNSYSAWVINKKHLYYIYISYKTKNFGEVVLKKTSLKAKFFNDIKLISKEFIKTNLEVFYCGKKIIGADAKSFEKIENTHFFQDEFYIYSYTKSEGLNKIAIQKNHRYFVPYLNYFADNENIYMHDAWTNKIIAIDENNSSPALDNILEVLQKNKNWPKIIMLNEDGSPNTASLEQWNNLGQFKSHSSIFNYFFPDANARWNKNKCQN